MAERIELIGCMKHRTPNWHHLQAPRCRTRPQTAQFVLVVCCEHTCRHLQALPPGLTEAEALSPACKAIVDDMAMLLQQLVDLSHLDDAGEQEVSWAHLMHGALVLVRQTAPGAVLKPVRNMPASSCSASCCAGPRPGLVRRQLHGAEASAGGGAEGTGERRGWHAGDGVEEEEPAAGLGSVWCLSWANAHTCDLHSCTLTRCFVQGAQGAGKPQPPPVDRIVMGDWWDAVKESL